MSKSLAKKSLLKFNSALARAYLQLRKMQNKLVLRYFPDKMNLISGSPYPAFSMHRTQIDDLKNHIDADYSILDLPDYNNIGDHMIYEGSLSFLRSLPYQKNYEASLYSFEDTKVNKNDIILLQGGGNFGDVWSVHQKFRERIVSSFPDNKIIILPQTIYFQEPRNLEKAVSVFSAHPDLIICTRDSRSYKTAQQYFSKNKVLLLPDMASYIQSGLIKKKKDSIHKVLFLRRQDRELKENFSPDYIKNLEVKDWPTFNNHFNYLVNKHKKHRFYLNEGLKFIAKYDLIISTRLHGAIMGALVRIPTILINNSYGKNKMYYQKWLTDIPDFYFAESPQEVKKLVEDYFPSVINPE